MQTRHAATKTPILNIPLHKELPLLLLFCALIALFLTLAHQDSIIKNLIFSESIGISIYTSIKLIIYWRSCEKDNMLSTIIGILTGTVIGILIGALLTQTPLSSLFQQQKDLFIQLGAAVIFGSAISYFFQSRYRLHAQQQELQKQAQQRSEYEKNLMHSQLRLLQAQIEPHFLFNALANVVSLIDSKPETAKQILQQLSDFLRTSLQRTRDNDATIADEISLLRAYLNIQQLRMGERLQFTIECADKLLQQPLPPLLVQPLVENAIKHGIENNVTGGTVQVTFKQQDEQLSITVSNTGNSMQHSAAPGIGLKNIRQRLQTLYGKTATLTLAENQPSGVQARLSLPVSQRNIQK